jgi:hypothetical protein
MLPTAGRHGNALLRIDISGKSRLLNLQSAPSGFRPNRAWRCRI